MMGAGCKMTAFLELVRDVSLIGSSILMSEAIRRNAEIRN